MYQSPSYFLRRIESGIDQLPDEEKDLIRASVTSAINDWNPPPRNNITSEEENALRDLSYQGHVCYNFTRR